MIILLLIALVALAVTYGLFFLLFKLIWILFKNKRNLWPLILAGAATALLVLLTVLAAVKTYNSVIRPFAPIMQAIQDPAAVPTAGPHAFVTEDWSMVTFNGMVFSDPIHWMNLTAYVGLDVNNFRKKNNSSAENNFQLLGVIKYDAEEPVSIQEVHQMTLDMMTQDGRIQLEQTSYSPDKQILFIKGRVYAQNGASNFLVLNTAQGENIYYAIALGNNDLTDLQNSLDSFRLTHTEGH